MFRTQQFEPEVDILTHQPEVRANRRRRRQPSRSSSKYRCGGKKCDYCGLSHKPTRDACPASGKQCKNCTKIGHYASVCHSPAVHLVADDPEDYDDSGAHYVSLHTIVSESGTRATETFCLISTPNKTKVAFHIDTRAEQNILPFETYSAATGDTTCRLLHPTKTILLMHSKSRVIPNRATRLCLSRHGKVYKMNFIVVPGKVTSLLSHKASQDMGLITIRDSDDIQSPIKESCANPVHGRHLVSSFASLGTSYRLRDELEQLPEKQYVYVT